MGPGEFRRVRIVVILRGRLCFGEEPKHQNNQATAGGEQKAGAPTVLRREVDEHDGADHGGDIRAGVEDAGCEGAVFLGEPFGNTLDGGGEVTRLSQTEKGPADAEAERAANQTVRGRRKTPPEDCAGVTEARADLVDQLAGEQKADCVSKLKGGADLAVEDVVDRDLFADFGQEDAQDDSIQVVDGGTEKEQRQDPPTEARGHSASICADSPDGIGWTVLASPGGARDNND